MNQREREEARNATIAALELANAELRKRNAQLLEACKAFVAKLNAEGLAHYPLLKEQYEAAVAAIAAAEQEH